MCGSNAAPATHQLMVDLGLHAGLGPGANGSKRGQGRQVLPASSVLATQFVRTSSRQCRRSGQSAWRGLGSKPTAGGIGKTGEARQRSRFAMGQAAPTAQVANEDGQNVADAGEQLHKIVEADNAVRGRTIHQWFATRNAGMLRTSPVAAGTHRLSHGSVMIWRSSWTWRSQQEHAHHPMSAEEGIKSTRAQNQSRMRSSHRCG